MSLRLRQIEIRITTLRGMFGIRLPIQGNGLVVVRANNTSGKSTVVQSLVYALGLEAMLTVNQQTPPLQYAVLERFQYRDEEIQVDESEVLIELENGKGEVVTIQRSIVNKTKKTNLVTVWRGPMLTSPSNAIEKGDYFVRIEGSAQRPFGFHTFLAEYLAWKLPTVTRFDGSEAPLYMECIFPLFIVEQKHGWSGIQARLPNHFRIREMGKRAIEFVLKLDSYEIAAQRQRIRDVLLRTSQNWERLATEIDAKVGALGGIIRNLPRQPIKDWPPVPAPLCLVFDGAEWEGVTEAILRLSEKVRELSKKEIRIVSEAVASVTEALPKAQKQLSVLEIKASSVFRDAELEEAQNSSIRSHVAALETDLQNYQDLKRLRDIGSDLKLSVVVGRCPTCDQEINDVLLPQVANAPPMSFQENINFISGQIEVFQSMLRDSERVLEARKRSAGAIRAKIQELRSDIRAFKQTLTSPNNNASAADVRERMNIEANLQKFRMIVEQLELASDKFESMSLEFAKYSSELEKLKSDMSEEDQGKLRTLEASLTSQLEQYGFSSIRPSLLSISRETYRPTYEGFDLGFNLSASDMIRTIWSYLFGLMEVSRDWNTNHLGLLVLDEPRQQQTDKVSFKEFAKRASEASSFGAQVLLFTSEDHETLSAMLANVNHYYVNFEDKMIQPIGPR